MESAVINIHTLNAEVLDYFATQLCDVPLDHEVHIFFDFEGGEYGAAFAMAERLEVRTNTIAHASGPVFGSAIMPFLACKQRIAYDVDSSFVINSCAFKHAHATLKLHSHIDAMPNKGIFTSDMYADYALQLFQTAKRMRDLDSKMYEYISSHTHIPAHLLFHAQQTGELGISLTDALEWNVITTLMGE